MMQYLTMDFETYYDNEYSLSKKHITMQDYIYDPRFEVLMVSLKWGDRPAYAVEAQDIAQHFARIDWSKVILVNHNAFFDASILNWRYGYRPAILMDTMSMAKSLGFKHLVGGASLQKCVDFLRENGYAVPPKGKEVVDAKGKRRADFTHEQWEAYKRYCLNDSEITWFLFRVLKQYLPDSELLFQDMILRCYTEPVLKVHLPTVAYELQQARDYHEAQINALCEQLNTEPDSLAKELRSNPKFAELLREQGGITQAEADAGVQGLFIIPEKPSPTSGENIWAFGKKDEGFLALAEHENPKVRTLFAARTAAKSNITITRCEKMLIYGSYPALPMGYNIGGAHTGRLSGGLGGSANMQNLPAGRNAGQSDLLRRSIIAPDGMVCVNFDSSQIEARVMFEIAQFTDGIELFASGKDLYSMTASTLYQIPYDEIMTGRKSRDAETAAHYKSLRQRAKAADLGAVYGQGYVGFQTYALTQMGVAFSLEESKQIIGLWRATHQPIVKFWRLCDTALSVMYNGGSFEFGGRDGKLFLADGSRMMCGVRVPGIRLPNGMWLNYPYLRKEVVDGRSQFVFGNGREQSKTYGSKVAENITQAVAFAIMKEQGLAIHQRYPCKMNTHDEWVVVAPRSEAEQASQYMKACMEVSPRWLPDIVLAAVGSWAQSYGSVPEDSESWLRDYPDNPDRIHRLNLETGEIF